MKTAIKEYNVKTSIQPTTDCKIDDTEVGRVIQKGNKSVQSVLVKSEIFLAAVRKRNEKFDAQLCSVQSA